MSPAPSHGEQDVFAEVVVFDRSSDPWSSLTAPDGESSPAAG